MSSPPYGYRSGPRDIRYVKIDGSTSDIVAGDMLVIDTAGYYEQIAAGGLPGCVAVDSVDSPTSDGDVEIRADFSPDSVYEYPADEGTVTQALVGAMFDVGGPQSADIDAGTDNVLKCVDVDTSANTVFVKLAITYISVT